jgi:hypothetical protein
MEIYTYSKRNKTFEYLKLIAMSAFGWIFAIVVNTFLSHLFPIDKAKIITLCVMIPYLVVVGMFIRSKRLFGLN